MTLYNLKSADGSWRITKFTNDLEVESSYITSLSECECPAGSRPTCRHRQMLPKMLEVQAEDSALFYDFERDQFFEPLDSEANQSPSDTTLEATFPIPLTDKIAEPHSTTVSAADFESVDVGSNPTEATKAAPHPTIGHIKRRI